MQMKKFLFALIIFTPLFVLAQPVDRKTVILTGPANVDVEYVLWNGTLGFNREDVRGVINSLKAQYPLASQFDSTAFDDALASLTTTAAKIVVVQYDLQSSRELQALDYLFRIHIVATLLRQGKATVVLKATGQSETKLVYTWPQILRRDTLFTFFTGDDVLLKTSVHNLSPMRRKTDVTSDTTESYVVFEEPRVAPEPKTYDKVFVAVEQGPMWPKDYAEYLRKNQKYSQAARDLKVEGKVYLKFIVNKDGSLEEITVMRGIHPDLNQEAIRLVKEGARWTPGKQDGQVVRAMAVLPVSFTLSKK